jgi:hypothetical protein
VDFSSGLDTEARRKKKSFASARRLLAWMAVLCGSFFDMDVLREA